MQKVKLQFKIQKFVGGVTFLGLVLPYLVFAADAPHDIPLTLSIGILGRNQVASLADYIGLVYQYMVGVAGILAVAMIMYGGIKWIFAGTGDKKAAMEKISNAVIGLILALGSWLLLNTINPALLQLRMPEIFRVSSQRLLAAQWCPNSGEYAGDYNCGNPYTLNVPNGPVVGSCIGSSCDAGEECHRDRLGRGIYKCLKTSVRDSVIAGGGGGICDQITNISDGGRLLRTDDQERFIVYCASDFISNNCTIGEFQGRVACVSRRAAGAGCDNNDDCQVGLRCNFEAIPNHCVANGALPAGEPCSRDGECASNICNQGYINDKCAPVDGESVGVVCKRNRECGSGLICWGPFERCIARNSLPRNLPCSNNEQCRNGLSCRRGGLSQLYGMICQ